MPAASGFPPCFRLALDGSSDQDAGTDAALDEHDTGSRDTFIVSENAAKAFLLTKSLVVCESCEKLYRFCVTHRFQRPRSIVLRYSNTSDNLVWVTARLRTHSGCEAYETC